VVNDAFLGIFNRFNSRVHHIEEKWRNDRQENHLDVLVRHLWCSVKPPQDLEGPVEVRMMVRVSLKTECNGRTHSVPRVDAPNAFINAVLVFLSAETVVLQIIDRFHEAGAYESIGQLELQAAHSKQFMDGE